MTTIDAVVTWVDGEDPTHVAKRARFAGDADHSSATAATRFASRREIDYCVASILRFCPFVRHVFVVTDDQRPPGLDRIAEAYPGRVEVVDHTAIYAGHEDLLPVFSSRSIETMIHRVPALAERFVYFNDDMFVARPLAPEHFFRDGLPVLRGRLARFPRPLTARLKRLLAPGARRAGFKVAQQNAARLLGRTDSYLLAEHHPHAMRRSSLARYFEPRPELLRQQAGHRFRSDAQFSPIALANHLELVAGAPVAAPSDSAVVKPPKGRQARARMKATLEAMVRGEHATLCAQSLDAMEPTDRTLVMEALERRIGAAAGIT